VDVIDAGHLRPEPAGDARQAGVQVVAGGHDARDGLAVRGDQHFMTPSGSLNGFRRGTRELGDT